MPEMPKKPKRSNSQKNRKIQKKPIISKLPKRRKVPNNPTPPKLFRSTGKAKQAKKAKNSSRK